MRGEVDPVASCGDESVSASLDLTEQRRWIIGPLVCISC